jgi:hypothetical protein
MLLLAHKYTPIYESGFQALGQSVGCKGWDSLSFPIIVPSKKDFKS